jgi:riboflavin synthase
MFTGLVEEVGVVTAIEKYKEGARIGLEANQILQDIQLGDSIAVNGVCLTASHIHQSGFFADVMEETLNRTALKMLGKGSKVNLERALAANGRFGGHMVQGHIDGTGTITHLKKDSSALWITVKVSHAVEKYVVEKGSIAIDGISLTVAKVEKESFCVSIIPHTLKETTLPHKKVGDLVNIENDIVGKYIEKFLGQREEEVPQSKITQAFLTKAGF